MKLREMLKSKIDDVIITRTALNYNGSIGIDSALLEACDIIAGEKVHVLNYHNGIRLETYIIAEKKGSGIIALYGPAARCGSVGDKLCIISYAMVDDTELKRMRPKIVKVKARNRIARVFK